MKSFYTINKKRAIVFNEVLNYNSIFIKKIKKILRKLDEKYTGAIFLSLAKIVPKLFGSSEDSVAYDRHVSIYVY